jgi:hypothetical protein
MLNAFITGERKYMAQWLLSLLSPKAIVKELLKPKHNRTQLVGYNKCLPVCIIFFGIVTKDKHSTVFDDIGSRPLKKYGEKCSCF